MKIIKNPSTLSPDYIPDTVCAREDYIKFINGVIRKSDVPSTFVVRGNPGTGKTVLGKYLVQMNKEYRGVYVNCYVHSTDRSIVSEIIGKDNPRAYDFQNISSDRMYKVMFDIMPEKNNLIVLDEVHSLKKNQGQILYLLSRSRELGGPIIKLVILTMEEPELFLDKSTLSGLGKYNRISLKEYSYSELYEILSRRAEVAFYIGTFDKSAVERCAQLTEETGNARDAIELLKTSALLAEERDESLDEDIVVEAYNNFSPPIEDSSLINMEEDEIKLLRGLIEQTGSGTRFKSSDIKDLDPSMPDSRVYRFLRVLENSGFIKKNKIGKGYGGGVENEYSFRIPTLLLLERLTLVEDSISSRKKL
jgi:cell division control protein 6